jgi:hypothetical protein
MSDPLSKERVKAATWILERLYGRAPQEITGADGAPLIPGVLDVSRMTTEEKRTAIAGLIAKSRRQPEAAETTAPDAE